MTMFSLVVRVCLGIEKLTSKSLTKCITCYSVVQTKGLVSNVMLKELFIEDIAFEAGLVITRIIFNK